MAFSLLICKNDTTYNAMHVQASIQRCVMNENFFMLWHWRLRHISIDKIKRLVNDRVLSTLDFVDFLTLVWTVLRESRPISQKKVLREAHTYQRSYIQTFVVQLWTHMVINTSFLSLMITHDICISTCFITRTKHQMPLKFLRLEQKNNEKSKLRS